MPLPRNFKEFRGLQECLAHIRRLVLNLASLFHPFSHLMKKRAPFKWDDSYHKVFDNIKSYLSSPRCWGHLFLASLSYIVAHKHSLGALCAHENSKGKEKVLYYLSCTLVRVRAELNYSPIEKMCLAHMFAIQKKRHYMQVHTIYFISKPDLVKYILSRLILNG